jgi:hypothetical protein
VDVVHGEDAGLHVITRDGVLEVWAATVAKPLWSIDEQQPPDPVPAGSLPAVGSGEVTFAAGLLILTWGLPQGGVVTSVHAISSGTFLGVLPAAPAGVVVESAVSNPPEGAGAAVAGVPLAGSPTPTVALVSSREGLLWACEDLGDVLVDALDDHAVYLHNGAGKALVVRTLDGALINDQGSVSIAAIAADGLALATTAQPQRFVAVRMSK